MLPKFSKMRNLLKILNYYHYHFIEFLQIGIRFRKKTLKIRSPEPVVHGIAYSEIYVLLLMSVAMYVFYVFNYM